MDYKYCVQCGAKLKADAKFCDHCGAKQPELAPKRGEVQHQATSSPERPTREELHRQQVTQAAVSQPTVAVKQPTSQSTTQSSNINNNYQQQTEARPNQQQYAHSNAYNESGQPGLLNSFDIWVKNAFHPNVCMGRADFWWSYLGLTIISFIATIAFIVSLYIDQDIVLGLFAIMIGIFMTVLSVCGILVEIERLHDTGRSGWNYCWNFLPFFVEIVVLILLCQPTNRKVTKWPRP